MATATNASPTATITSTEDGVAGPIFIVGYMHTGTSLLKTMLRKEPSLFAAAGETHFFQDLTRICTEFPDLNREEVLREYVWFLIKLAFLGFKRAHQSRHAYSLGDFGLTGGQFETILAAARGCRRHTRLFGLVMDALTQFNQKQRWLEKSPEHVNSLKQILQLWPDARVLELVRDPRATLASRKIRRSDEEWLNEKERRERVAADHSSNYDPLLDTLMWKDAIHAAADAKRAYPGNILTVRYEALAADPEATVRRICLFAGLSFRPEMLAVGWVNAATQAGAGSGTTAGGVSMAAVEEWPKSLSPEEIYLCQRLARREMEQLGYSLTAVPLAARIKAPALLGRSALRLYSRARRRRPAQIAVRARDTSRRMVRRALNNFRLYKEKP